MLTISYVGKLLVRGVFLVGFFATLSILYLLVMLSDIPSVLQYIIMIGIFLACTYLTFKDFCSQRFSSIKKLLFVWYGIVCLGLAIFMVSVEMSYRFKTMFVFMISSVKSNLQKKYDRSHEASSLALLHTHMKLLLGFLTSKNDVLSQGSILDFKASFFNYSDAAYLFHEIFDQQCYKFKSMNDKPFILDCGSNIGFSIFYFKLLYPQAEIIGFEPDKKTYDVLVQNITNNKLSHVAIYEKALHPTKKTLSFYSNDQRPGSLVMNMFKTSGCATETIVEATALSPFITKRVDFLKLDVEGAEAAILQELADTGKLAFIDQMIVEYHLDINNLIDTLTLFNRFNFNYLIVSTIRTPFNKRDRSAPILLYAYQKEDLKK